jgi:predicted transposase/invertase (TIGR01784 family)
MEMYKKMWLNKDVKAIEENKLLIMLDLEQDELLKLSKGDRVVFEYMKELNRVNQDPDFREYMTKEEDNAKIRNTEINGAMRKGIAQGITQGENKRNIEIARNLFAMDMKLEDISKATGLSQEEINNILKS